MADPRILPPETLAQWERDAKREFKVWSPAEKSQVDDRRILALLNHIEALAEQVRVRNSERMAHVKRIGELAEQVDTLTGALAEANDARGALIDLDRDWRSVRARAEKAEADLGHAERVRDSHWRGLGHARDWAEREKARADAAEQRLADRDKAITPEVIAEAVRRHLPQPVGAGRWPKCFSHPIPVDYTPEHVGEVVVAALRALLTEEASD